MLRLVLITLFFSIKLCNSEIRPCATPSGKKGFCISINDCTVLNERYFTKGTILTPDDYAELETRKCFKNVLIQNFICCDEFDGEKMDLKPLKTVLSARNVETPPNTCGKSTASNPVPWMAIAVAESISDKTKFLGCTGSMVTSKNILFPSRCFENVKYILLGFQTADITQSCIKSDNCKAELKVLETDFTITRHPEQSLLPIVNNIAIVRLKTPVNNPKISQICLPIYDDRMYLKELEDGVQIHGITRRLQYLSASFDMIPADLCQQTYKEHFSSKTNLCLNSTTLREGADLTLSLSSSAVWNEPRMVLYGFMSYGDSIKFKKPDVFNHVRPYLSWILDAGTQVAPVTPKPNVTFSNLVERSKSGAFSFDNCGNVDGKNKVSGGQNVKLYSYPWFALLKYENGAFKCGGTLISDRHILTAGHCFKPGSGKVISVRLGEHDLSTESDCQFPEDDEEATVKSDCAPATQDMEIDRIIMHPKYDNNPGAPHDIALVKLKTAPTLNSNVQKICLPFLETLINMETPKIIVVGFGLTDDIGTVPTVMQQAALDPSPFYNCTKRFAELSNATLNNDLQFCAGGTKGVGSCSGDSGGPIMTFGTVGNKQKFMQYGVVSAGPQCATFEGYPGVYVRVTAYLDWIVQNVD